MKAFTLALLVMAGVVWTYALRHDPPPPPPRPVYVLAAYQPVPPEPPRTPAPPSLEPEREPAEGLPVPIYPGTRVSEAEIAPPRVELLHEPVERRERAPRAVPSPDMVRPAREGILTVVSQLSGTQQRADANARAELDRRVSTTLGLPASWKAPRHLVDQLIVESRGRSIVKDYGTLYEAQLDVDFKPHVVQQIQATYRRELVAHRIVTMGGGLGFVLACLAALAGYIRADEATKGYYTNWLRAVAAAGVGASGVVLYRLLA